MTKEILLETIREFENSDFTDRSKNRYFTIDESIYILPIKHIVLEAFRKLDENKNLTTNTAEPYLKQFFDSYKAIDINYENSVLPLYQEIAYKLISYRDSRRDLIDLIEDMNDKGLMTIALNDKGVDGTKKLQDIDPFTFYSNFNRNLKPKNRAKILKYLKEDWELTGKIPTFDPKVPWMQNQSAWFFPWEKDRNIDDIEMLWKLFLEVINDNVSSLTFNRCLQIKYVNNNLSFGLFWINSNKYISLDGSTKEYLKGKLSNYNGQDLSELKFDGYMQLLDMIKEELPDESFYQIVSRKNNNDTDDEGIINNKRALFVEIANLYGLRHQTTIPVNFFQIYPNIPIEGSGGTHYEFIVEKDVLYLDIHIESRANIDKKFLRNKIKEIGLGNGYGFHTGVRPIRIDLSNSTDEEIQQTFKEVFELFEPAIRAAYNTDNTYSALDDEEENKKDKIMNLNTILYGPPGTGKTYKTIDKALMIIDGEIPIKREDAKKRFKSLQESGQIDFVTFHQSYSYEEFIEGIKAINDGDLIKYKVTDGVFKNLCEKANGFSFTKLNDIQLTNYIVKTTNTHFILENNNEQKLEFPFELISDLINSIDANQLSLDEILTLNGEDIVEKSGTKFLASYIYRHRPVIHEIVKKIKQLNNEDTNQKNFVLIVDEINRGNISKIFGELITLIETSKRLNGKEELRVTLPYSGKSFGVPSNLYIIGTMNTADRSIALLDTALRRRFKFTEMMPNIKLVREEVGIVDEIDIATMLEKINKRIEVLYDRDHMIGHAYLLDVESFSDLNDIMENKIIPLLQEYFYDDWEKIDMIFNGNGFIKSQEVEQGLFSENFEYDVLDEQKVYSLDKSKLDDPEAYKAIY